MADKQINLEVMADVGGVITGFQNAKQAITDAREGISDMAKDSKQAFTSMKEGFTQLKDNVKDFKNNLMSMSFTDLKTGLSSFFNIFKTGSGIARLALTGLKAALAAVGIGLLITAVTLLVGWLMKSEAVTKALGVVTAYIGGAFDALIGSIGGFCDIIKNVFLVVVEQAKSAIKIMGLLLKGDFKGALAETNVAMARAAKLVSDTTDAVVELASNVNKAGKAMVDLKNRTSALAAATTESISKIADLNAQLEMQNQIASDNSVSDATRLAAKRKAFQTELQISKETTKLAKEDYLIKKGYSDAAKSIGGDEYKEKLRTTAEAYAVFIGAQNKTKLAVKQYNSDVRDIKQETLDADKDMAFTQIDANRDRISIMLDDVKGEVNGRQALLKSHYVSAVSLLDNETKDFEKATGKKIDMNKILGMANAEERQEYIKGLNLSKDAATTLSDIVDKRIQVDIDNVNTNKKLNEERIADNKSFNDASAKIAKENLDNGIAYMNESATNELNLKYATLEQNARNTITNETKLKEALLQISIDKGIALQDLTTQQANDAAMLAEERRAADKEAEIELMSIDIADKNKLKEEAEELHQNNLRNIKDKNEKKIKANTLSNEKFITDAKLKQNELRKKNEQAACDATLSLLDTASSFIEKDSAWGKAVAITTATIQTYVGASKALGQGGFAGIAMGVAVIAAGMANVYKIIATKPPKKESGGSGTASNVSKFAKGGWVDGKPHSQGGTLIEAENKEFVVNANAMSNPQMANMVMAINDAGNKGQTVGVQSLSEERVIQLIAMSLSEVKVYVLESEMTDTQKKVKIRETRNTF